MSARLSRWSATRRRPRTARHADHARTASASRVTSWPATGSRRGPAEQRGRMRTTFVVLPAPYGPESANTLPSRRRAPAPSRTTWSPKDLHTSTAQIAGEELGVSSIDVLIGARGVGDVGVELSRSSPRRAGVAVSPPPLLLKCRGSDRPPVRDAAISTASPALGRRVHEHLQTLSPEAANSSYSETSKPGTGGGSHATRSSAPPPATRAPDRVPVRSSTSSAPVDQRSDLPAAPRSARRSSGGGSRTSR